MRTILLALACSAALAACGKTVTLTDDVDVTWDFQVTPFDRYVNKLHTPYVLGSTNDLWVTSSDGSDRVDRWSIVSSDPSVLRIEQDTYDGVSLGVHAVAVGEGTVDLAVIDDHGVRVGHGVASVAAPDTIELDAHGYLIVGEADRAPVTDVRIAADDTATYLVRYYRDGHELYGSGVLAAAPGSGLGAVTIPTFCGENREWLQLTPHAAGTGSVALTVAGAPAGSFPVTGVAESDIADVSLIAQSEQNRKDGDWLVVLAQASDAAGNRIFGVNYAWQVDGVDQEAYGDLYRYEYKHGDTQMLTVARGGHGDAIDIQSDRGFVDSSNRVGCAAAGGGSFGACALVLLVVGTRRRVRRVH